MKKFLILITLTLLLASATVHSQQERCGMNSYMEALKKNPELLRLYNANQARFETMKNNKTYRFSNTVMTPIVIPVAVHFPTADESDRACLEALAQTRAIGEGTNKALDLDKFDLYYHHMFLWDSNEEKIVGAYRMGLGKDIYKARGINVLQTFLLKYHFLKPLLLNTPIHFPFGTLGVNTIGCFLIGLILGYFIKDGEISNSYTVLLATGFCGGFTTFSAFAFENQMFLKNGDFTNFILYSLGSVAFGILAVFFGIFLSKFI